VVWRRRRPCPSRLRGKDEIDNLIPGLGPWGSQVFVRRKNDRFEVVRPEALHVTRRILDVEVCTYSCLLLHEAEIPVWDVVIVEPFDRLPRRHLVKTLYEEPMRDDSNSYVVRRETTKGGRSTWHRRDDAKQLPLSNGEPVKRFVPARRLVDSRSVHLPRLLRLGGERRGEEAARDDAYESAARHFGRADRGHRVPPSKSGRESNSVEDRAEGTCAYCAARRAERGGTQRAQKAVGSWGSPGGYVAGTGATDGGTAAGGR